MRGGKNKSTGNEQARRARESKEKKKKNKNKIKNANNHDAGKGEGGDFVENKFLRSTERIVKRDV